MPLGSPLAGSGRVARKSSILGASLSLFGSWGIAGGLVALEVIPFDTLVTFPFAPGCLAIFGGLPEGGGGTLLGRLFSGSATSGGMSGLALLEEEAWIAGGSKHLLPSSAQKKP